MHCRLDLCTNFVCDLVCMRYLRWAEAYKAYQQGLKIEPDNEILKEGMHTTVEELRETLGEDPVWLWEGQS